jgi:hypothetical protein
MSKGKRMLPVWFFVGVLSLIYGTIILVASLLDYSQPTTVVLAQYHAGVYGGIILLLIGGFYTICFWPSSHKDS